MKSKLSAHKLFRAGLLAFVLVIMACASVAFAEGWEANGVITFEQDYIRPATITVTCDCETPHTVQVALGSKYAMEYNGLESFWGTYDPTFTNLGNGNFCVNITNLQPYVDLLNERSGVKHFLPEGAGVETTATFSHLCGTELGNDNSTKGVYYSFPAAPANCTTPTLYHTECHICGKTDIGYLPAGHIFERTTYCPAATCTEPGDGYWGTCTLCGQSGWVNEGPKIPAKGHQFSASTHKHTEDGIECWCYNCYKYLPLTEEDLAGLDFSSTKCEICNPPEPENTPQEQEVPEDQGSQEGEEPLALAHKTVVAADAARITVAQVGSRDGSGAVDKANAPVLTESAYSKYSPKNHYWGTDTGPQWTSAALELVVTTRTYKVQWVTSAEDGSLIVLKEDPRNDVNTGDTASVTDEDKALTLEHEGNTYTFDAGNGKNVLTKVVAEDGSTVLVLYMKKTDDTTPSYIVHWVDQDGRDLTEPELRDGVEVGEEVSITDADKERTFPGYKFDSSKASEWTKLVAAEGKTELFIYYAKTGGTTPEIPPVIPENPPVNPPAPGEDIPEPDVPLSDIPSEDPPLTDIPEEDPPLEDIPEEDPPLSGVPETGDISQLWTMLALLTGAGLVWMVLDSKKHRKDA